MKKEILCYILALVVALTVGCNGKKQSGLTQQETQLHEEHLHETAHEAHAHEEGHRHGEHDPEGHEHHEHALAENRHDHAGHEAGIASDNHPSDEIVFPAEQASRTQFEVETVTPCEFSEVIRCSGEIASPQGLTATLVAPVAGVVTYVEPNLSPATAVSPDRLLFRISSEQLASGDMVEKARIAYHQAEQNFKRIGKLYESKLVTRETYLAAEAEYLRTKSEYEPLARINSETKGTEIKAPIEGYVTDLPVSSGDYVEMGQPLATLSQNRNLLLTALVSERYFPRLASIRDASFKTPAMNDYKVISDLGGHKLSIGHSVAKGSTLIPVVFEFTGNGEIADGSYADVILIGTPKPEVIALPLTAITEQQGLYYVYVQLDESCYRRQEVTLGGNDGQKVEILSGVRPGDRIVTKGAINVKMAAASSAIPHGHSHSH